MQKNWIHWVIISLGIIVSCSPYRVAGQSPSLFSQVNSRYDEQFPVLSPDGQTLYFVRNHHPNNIGIEDLPDIWLSTRKSNNFWGMPIHMGLPINNLKANRLAGVNATGQTLYLAENDGLQGWVSITHRQGRRWSLPQSMIIERFVPGASASFTVSQDEQALLISSEQTDGTGGLDIYVAFRLGERRWSHPLNLGPVINTPGQESWAMLSADGQTLYLASDGHPDGAGGLDLWMSRRQDDTWKSWTPPVNLGPTINSAQPEMSLAIASEGRTVIINRLNEQQQYDLDLRPLPQDRQPFPVAILSGQLRDSRTNQPLTGDVFYRLLGQDSTKTNLLPLDKEAAYSIIVPLNRGAEIYGNLPGYLPLSERFDVTTLSDRLDTPNPQIAAWADNNTFYWQEEEEIQRIQKQLQLIEDEVEELDKDRKAHQYKLAERTYKELEDEDIIYSEPELEALERRFNIYQRQIRDTLSMHLNQATGTNGGEARKSFIEEPADETTVQLRKQFREQRPFTNPSAKKTNAGKKTLANALPAAHTFWELKKRAEKELTYEMLPRVQAELVQELFPFAWRALQGTTSSVLLKSLAEKEDSIRIQVRQGLGQFIMAPDAFGDYSNEDFNLWNQLKNDLKNVLRQQVRSHLQQSLRPLILKAIRLELDFQVKKLMETSQQEALDFKIRNQQKIEKSSKEVEIYLDQVPAKAGTEIDSAPEPVFSKITKDLLLTPISEGQILELKNVHFTADDLEIQSASYAELDRLSLFLQNNPKISIQIRVHTHGWCDHIKASNLTKGRAHLLTHYLTTNGIDQDRIHYAGLGKTVPRMDNKTLAGRAANQRIEIKIRSIQE